MKKSDQFFLIAVITATAVNVASNFLFETFHDLSKYFCLGVVLALVVWGLYRLAELILNHYKTGRFAVLIFFLNSKNELLLIQHPFHKRFLPVGGRLKPGELPHEAVKKRLKEEAGISNFIFHPDFHNENLMISELVENVPRPHSVHKEFRKQRGPVWFHYAFVYVCKFSTNDENIDDSNEHRPSWKTLQQIKRLPQATRPFDDIINEFGDILKQLNNQ